MSNIKLADWQQKKASKAVRDALKAAGGKGMSEYDVHELIKRSLGINFLPESQQLGMIMLPTYCKHEGDGRFYRLNFAPSTIAVAEAKANGEKTKNDGQSITLDGDIVVTVKGAGHDFRSKAVKVIIFLSSVILLIVTNPLGLW